ncbi:type 1 fimbrial protein [Serratia ureilytica]|nr:type 1 fimbrial protein [Serratia ureilytica]
MSCDAFAEGGAPGWGRVNMQGAILYTACAISTGSREQIIDMGVLPVSEIRVSGKGAERDFSIDLINCSIKSNYQEHEKNNYFNVTFDGKSEGEAFRVHGDAKGVALQILDSQGNLARPGMMLPSEGIYKNDMKLNYAMRLVSTGKPVGAGAYFSAIRFKLDYY